MTDELLVRCCAPTLAGIKTGSLFACPYDTRETLLSQLRLFNRAYTPCGLRILPLRFGANRALLYLYRPADLQRDLRQSGAQSILAEAGYETIDADRCVKHLIQRMRRREAFPHEIGLFLGYPPGDVRGFMENGAKNYQYAGLWKVYGDEALTRRRFEKYRKCTEAYCRSLRAGFSLSQLAVAM